MRFYVYAILVSDQVRYIGKGSGQRLKDHVRTAKRINRGGVGGTAFHIRLAAALQGGEAVEARILSADLNEREALEDEIARIAAYPEGALWNSNPGGAGPTSEAARRAWENQERRNALSRLSSARWASDEYRANYSLGAKGAHSAEIESSAAKRRWESEQYREAQRAVWRDPDYRKRVLAERAIAMGRPECAAKISEASRRSWASSEYRERRAAAVSAAYDANPELRERMSSASKARWADPVWREKMLLARKAAREAKMTSSNVASGDDA